MYVWEETFVTRAFDPWTAASLVVLAAMLHGVWRLWRGMRIDAFQRDLRTMRQQPQTSIVFPGFRAAESSRTGFFQISLLPLMLASSGLAMLLAQAQRPDDLSRPLTWALFVGVGAWYGIRAWPNRRGVGPLRNFTWAGVYSAVILSAGLWAFYLAVDLWWGNGIGRLNSSFSVLLWWTAVGGFAGGLIGAFRANLVYGRSRTEVSPAKRAAPPDAVDLAIAVAPRKRRLAWGAIAMACFASFLIHCSTVPHLSRVVKYKWYWHDHYVYEPTNTINLLALPTPTPDDHYLSFQTQSNVDLFPEDTLELTRTTQTVAANPPQDQRPEILVATLTRAVAARTRITPDIVKLAPYDGAKPGVIQDASRVVGMYSGMRLGAGEAVLESQLVPPPESIKSGIQSNDARSTDRAVDNSFDTIVEIESVELLTADSLVDGFVNPVQPPTTRLPALDFTGPIVETGPPRVATGLSLPRLTVEPLSTTLTEVVPQIESVSEASPVLPPNVQIRSTIAESAGPPAAGQTKNGTVYDRDASGTYTTSDPTVAATDASVPLPEGVLVQKSSSVDSLEPKSDATVPRGIRANGRPLPPVDPANKRVVTIIKSDGRVISGTIVSSDKKELKIQTDKGLVVVPRNEIDEIKDPRRSPIF